MRRDDVYTNSVYFILGTATRVTLKGRFLLFQVYRNFANLFSKLSVSTFYEEISKFQLKVHT